MARFSQFQSQGKGVSEEDIKNKYNTFKDISKDDLSKPLLQEVAKQKAELLITLSWKEWLIRCKGYCQKLTIKMLGNYLRV